MRPTPVTDAQRERIRGLLLAGKCTSTIVAMLHVTKMQVAAVKAHNTMGTYEDREASGRRKAEISEEDLASGDEDVEEAASGGFALEAALQRALEGNLELLEPGLTLIAAQEALPSGRLDILAENGRGELVVVEIKAGTASDSVLAQLSAYMGDLIKKYPERHVRGMVVAFEFSDRLLHAAPVFSNIKLTRYRFAFSFDDIS